MKTEIKNVLIENTKLGCKDDGLFTSFLFLKLDGCSGQGFGGYYLRNSSLDSWISNILSVVKVNNWEELKGKYCRIIGNASKIYAIGNILDDVWFCPSMPEWKLVKSSDILGVLNIRCVYE